MTTKGDVVPLSNGTLAGLGPACTRVDFHSGDCLFKVGAAADQVFILLQGSVTIHCAIPGQTPQTATIDQPGRLFGWEPLVFRHPARLTAATAASDRQALRLDTATLAADEAITAEGRLSRRYLLRAAQQALQAYRTDIAALEDGQRPLLPLDPLVSVLLRSAGDEAARSWGTAVGFAGTVLGASRATLFCAEAGEDRTSVCARWTGDPEEPDAAPRPLSAIETPWFWSRLEAQQEIVLRGAGDLPEDAGSELLWLPEDDAACMLLPLHDGGGLRGALALEFAAAEGLPDANGQLALAKLSAILALDLARRQHERQMERLAHKDALTGLTNGLLFHDRLELALARARRADRSVALLYLDLDGFDPMNREVGSEIGDLLLKEIAGRLRQCARECDTVGRIGDDEFAIMLEDIDGAEAALQAAQRVMNALNQPIHVEEQSIYVGVSVGIALYPEHAVESAALISAGAEAMSRAKQMTGSTYAFFSPDKDDRSGYRMQVEAELRAALAARELLAYYQPIVDIKTGRIQGAGAVAARRRHSPGSELFSADRRGDRHGDPHEPPDPAPGLPGNRQLEQVVPHAAHGRGQRVDALAGGSAIPGHRGKHASRYRPAGPLPDPGIDRRDPLAGPGSVGTGAGRT